MRANILLLATSLLLSSFVFDYQVIASNIPSTSSSQQQVSVRAKKKPTPYRGSGRRGEGGMF